MLANRFDYLYADDVGWLGISAEARDDLQQACVQTMAEYWDADKDHFRRLLDLRGCVP